MSFLGVPGMKAIKEKPAKPWSELTFFEKFKSLVSKEYKNVKMIIPYTVVGLICFSTWQRETPSHPGLPPAPSKIMKGFQIGLGFVPLPNSVIQTLFQIANTWFVNISTAFVSKKESTATAPGVL